MAGKWRKKLKWRGGVFWRIPIYLYKVPKSQGIGQLYSPRPPLSGYYPGTPLSGYYPGTPLEPPIWVPPYQAITRVPHWQPPIWVPPPYTTPPTPYHWQTLYMTCSPHLSKSKKARISIFHSIVRKLKCNKM